MVHGVAGYFLERARFARRASLTTLAVGLGGLSLLGLARTPLLHRSVVDTVRFGFEGPEQYVRRINLEQVRGHTSTLADVGQIELRVNQRQGGPRRSRAVVGQPQPRTREHGPGSADQDMMMRSVSRTAGVPVFQSVDLVLDRLVRPEYPPALIERNVEGKVMIQALVDTVGRVVEVQVLASTGEEQFETAAAEAVRKCLFRPYRPRGVASEVYAVFRFSFKIYD
jgi:TonB family protein